MTKVHKGSRRLATAIALLLGATASSQALPAAATPAPASAAATATPARQGKPNVVFILIDDMGYGDLSLTGNDRVKTPNIDHLATQGRFFSNFHQNAPICSSSRTALLTGRYQQRSGITGYISGHKDNLAMGEVDWVSPNVPTTAKGFKEAGYATAHVGKWHMGGGREIGDAPLITRYGFDESLTTFEGLGDRMLIKGDGLSIASSKLGHGKITWKDKHELTEADVDRSIDFIRRNKDQPFFLNLAFDDVHDPWEPDGEELHRVFGAGRYESESQMFAVLVEMDRQVGRLLAELDRLKLADNTIVVITSDNGPTAWPYYYKGGGIAPGSTAGMRGRKWSLYEGGTRLPMIIRWPGHIPAGTVDDKSLVMGMDFMPTWAHLAGFPVPAGSDGMDVTNVLEGHPFTRPTPVFWEYGSYGQPEKFIRPEPVHDRSPPVAMRLGDWKLLAYPDGHGAELYNLATDPDETTNVASANAARVKEMLPQLIEWRKTVMPAGLTDQH